MASSTQTSSGSASTFTRMDESTAEQWGVIGSETYAHRGRVADSILSFYASPTGRYRGFESLLRRDRARYMVRGSLLEEDKLVSSWALELTRL